MQEGHQHMTAMNKADGKALEQLVAIIEQVIADKDNVTVERDKRLTDKITNEQRQFDVVLTVKHQHHTVCIALECKDQSRPVGVPQVEAFYTKCEYTGVNQPVIVSASGFYNTARRKADVLGIRCLDIEEVGSFNWLLAQGMHVIERKLLGHQWRFFPEKEGVVDDSTIELVDENGAVVADAVLTANAQRILNDQLPELAPPTEQKDIVVRVNGQGVTLRNRTTGETTGVKFGVVRLTYSVSHTLEPHRLVQYWEKADDKHITDAAVTEFKLGDNAMRMVMVYKEGEGGQILLAPAPSTKKP